MDTKNSKALIGEERGKSKRGPKQRKAKGKRTAQPSRPKPLQLRKR